MIAHECQQGGPEWWALRCGVPTASEFSRIITPRTGKLSAQALGYACELIEQRVMGVPPLGVEGYTSHYMQAGIDMEPEARAWYAFDREVSVREVGFVLTDDGRFGCSPDGLIGEDGGLELKCPAIRTHARWYLEGGLPDEHRCQVHGALVVTGRDWWDFVSYARNMPALVVRVEPDEFTERMREALDEFHEMYADAWERLRGEIPGAADAQLAADASIPF